MYVCVLCARMYVRTYVCVCVVCVHVRMCVCVCVLCACMCVYMHACTSLLVHIDVSFLISTCTSSSTLIVLTYVRTYVCRSPHFAFRAQLIYCELLKSQKRFREAAWMYVRMSSETNKVSRRTPHSGILSVCHSYTNVRTYTHGSRTFMCS